MARFPGFSVHTAFPRYSNGSRLTMFSTALARSFFCLFDIAGGFRFAAGIASTDFAPRLEVGVGILDTDASDTVSEQYSQ